MTYFTAWLASLIMVVTSLFVLSFNLFVVSAQADQSGNQGSKKDRPALENFYFNNEVELDRRVERKGLLTRLAIEDVTEEML